MHSLSQTNHTPYLLTSQSNHPQLTTPLWTFFFSLLFSKRGEGAGALPDLDYFAQLETTYLLTRFFPMLLSFPKLLDPFIALPCLGFYRETPEHMLPAGVQEESELTFVKKALWRCWERDCPSWLFEALKLLPVIELILVISLWRADGSFALFFFQPRLPLV